MASIFSRVLGLAGIYDDEVDVDYDEEEDEAPDSNVLNAQLRRGNVDQNSQGGRNSGNVINLRGQGSFTSSVVITKPEGIEDAQQVTDYLRERRTILMNLEEAEPALARRIVDFLSGAVYALDGDFQKASRGVFIIAPSNVEVQPLKNDLKMSKGFFPFANGNYR